MGKIKSALEIALERTESVKSDKDSIGHFEAKQKGKKLANAFLEGTIKSLGEEIKKEAANEHSNIKQGIFDVLISQIILPVVKEDLKRIESSCQGLISIIGNKRFEEMTRQFIQIMNQYLNDVAQYEEAIKRQYGPKLRQKEEELSRRFGRPVKLDLNQDQEFAALFNQNLNALKANYQSAVDQVREEAKRLFTE
jgi:hypothetical protein